MELLGRETRERFGLRSRSQVGILLLSLVSVILLLSSLYSAEASVFKKAREAAIETASPVLELLSVPIGWLSGRLGAINDYFRVLEQNEALREENAALRQWEDEARSLRGVITALEELDAYKAPPPAKPVNAFVIGEANDAYAHSMIINAGAKDGVLRGNAAVDERGMVGRIVDVSSNAARILLLNDVQSRIPVFVEESYVEGLLIGRSTAQPTIAITKLANGDLIKPGQRVITSGAGGVLPRGLAVGVIAAVSEKEATVDLAADYARSRIVRIINYEFPDVEPTPLAASGASAAAAELVAPGSEAPAAALDVANLPALPPVAAPSVEEGD
ncbi:MAG: rod shape-determining protein MreC [Parvularculaceae bacterium]|nr:rod shape-determining protein MreC [Parvularculaceae bacterium]